jgi:hypothetical protein
MKKYIIFTALLTVLSLESISQIVFENGYFINESNQKINCFIKSMDWKNNPTKFEYKLSLDDSVRKADILEVKEFMITDVAKYIRANVDIDRSSNEINNLSFDRDPTFQEELLFLKVIIEGKASLFMYEDRILKRFFYKKNDSAINQLVYKRYFIETDTEKNIAKNNLFRQQLFIDLKCHGITSSDLEFINYNKRDLEKLFSRYNECMGSEYINYESKQKQKRINLSIRPGLNSSNLVIQNSSNASRNTKFGNEFNFRFGIETEIILPYYNNKWGLIVEPTYQYYKSEKTTEVTNVSGGILVSKVNYQSIELPIGVRHYFFINDKSKIFINVSYLFDFVYDSMIEFSRGDGSYLNSIELKISNNLALGLGYKYKNRYSLEMRYHTNRDILGDYLFWTSEYKSYSIIFGYSLVQNTP